MGGGIVWIGVSILEYRILGTQFSAVRNPRVEFLSCKYLYLLGFLFGANPSLGTTFTLILPCFYE
jgi:hypothetical protein